MSLLRREPTGDPGFEFTPDGRGYEVTKGERILGYVSKEKDGWRHDRHRWFRYARREDAALALEHFVNLQLQEVVP